MIKANLRSVVFVAALLPASLLSAWSQGLMSTPMGDDFMIQVFASANQGAPSRDSRVDLGILSRVGANRPESRSLRSYTIERTIRIRVSRNNGGSGRAVVQAFLLHDCYPCHLKLDGTELGPTPVIVMSGIDLNSVSDHRIVIEIPNSMPPGAINAELGWKVDEQ
jgi:hypothetical protein